MQDAKAGSRFLHAAGKKDPQTLRLGSEGGSDIFPVARLRLFSPVGAFDSEKPSELIEDLMIAATACDPGLEVATRNERDVRRFWGNTPLVSAWGVGSAR